MRPLALALAAILLAGCLTPADQPVQGDPVAHRELAQGSASGLTTAARRVLEDEAAWLALWAQHAALEDPRPPAPAVDFAKERVVAVALGQQTDGCWSIRVEQVVRSGGDVVVVVRTTDQHGPGIACTAAVTQPYHFVAIEERASPVRFEERRTTVDPGTVPTPSSTPPTPTGEVLSTRRLDRGSFSNVHEDTRAHLRAADAWESLWARHRPNASAPAVSFPNESVVAVVEHGPTGCFGIHVGNVTYDGDARRITVEVVHEDTPPGVACVAAIQDAYDFVAIPDREGDVAFVDRHVMADAGQAPAPSPEVRVLEQGGQSGLRAERRTIVADENEWRDVWAQHVAERDPPPPLPPVEWSSERVILVTLGEKPNACWGVSLGNATVEDGDVLVVEVVARAPPPDAFCADVVTHPFVFAAVAWTGPEARFVDA